MNERKSDNRITIRVTPFQARQIMKLRQHGVPEGQKLKSTTEVLIAAMLEKAKSLESEAEAVTERHAGKEGSP